MDHQALLFGVAAGPGSQPRRACRVEVDLIGAGVGSADEGLDVNVHGFGLSPTSLHLTPARSTEGRFLIWRSGDRSAAGLVRGEG